MKRSMAPSVKKRPTKTTIVLRRRFHPQCLSPEQIPDKQIKDEDNLGVKMSETYYKVCFSKMSTKKHKTWEHDGFLIISRGNTHGTLKDEEKKTLYSSGFKFTSDIIDGQIFQFGGKDIQIYQSIDQIPMDENESTQNQSKASITTSTNQMRKRKISSTVTEQISDKQIKDEDNLGDEMSETYYKVCFSKMSTKKHKTWEHYGFLIISRDNAHGTLKDEEKKTLYSSGFKFTSDIIDGQVFQFGGKDIQIYQSIDRIPVDEDETIKKTQNQSTTNIASTNQMRKISSTVTEQTPENQIKDEDNSGDEMSEMYYKVCYSKMSTRKHKKWEHDGFLTISGNNTHGTLKDEDGKKLQSSGFKFTSDIIDGEVFQFGGKDVQITEMLSRNPY